VAIFALLAGAIAGGLDDIINIRDITRLGLSVWQKLSLQGVTGVLVGVGLTIAGFTHQFFPGLGAPNLGWGLAVVVAIAVVATSNAVNLTDGVDGLAASCTALVFIGIAIIAVTRQDLAVAFLAAALAGAVVAFLIFNWFPARVFMGDAGSLALGCAIVALTTELHLLWLLPVLGIVFVVEAASVVVNVTAIRRFGTRVLRASPIHHHFEELGLRERRLVVAFAAAAAAGTAITVLFAHVAGPVS
jgi:phospho-N-acetylmuramoyl-pentapeptide-transferase